MSISVCKGDLDCELYRCVQLFVCVKGWRGDLTLHCVLCVCVCWLCIVLFVCVKGMEVGSDCIVCCLCVCRLCIVLFVCVKGMEMGSDCIVCCLCELRAWRWVLTLHCVLSVCAKGTEMGSDCIVCCLCELRAWRWVLTLHCVLSVWIKGTEMGSDFALCAVCVCEGHGDGLWLRVCGCGRGKLWGLPAQSRQKAPHLAGKAASFLHLDSDCCCCCCGVPQMHTLEVTRQNYKCTFIVS